MGIIINPGILYPAILYPVSSVIIKKYVFLSIKKIKINRQIPTRELRLCISIFVSFNN